MEVQSSNPVADIVQNLTQFAETAQSSQLLPAKKVLELANNAVLLFNDYEISRPVSTNNPNIHKMNNISFKFKSIS